MICLDLDLGRFLPCGFQKEGARGAGSKVGQCSECTGCPWPEGLSLAVLRGSHPWQLCLKRSVGKPEYWSFLESPSGDFEMQPGLKATGLRPHEQTNQG